MGEEEERGIDDLKSGGGEGAKGILGEEKGDKGESNEEEEEGNGTVPSP